MHREQASSDQPGPGDADEAVIQSRKGSGRAVGTLVAAMVAGISVLLLTAVLDHLFQPERASAIWPSRWYTLGGMGLLTLISALPIGRRIPQFLNLSFILLGSTALLEFARLSQTPYQYFYNMAVFFVVIFCFFLTRIHFRWGLVCSVAVFVLCNVYWLALSELAVDVVVILNFMVIVACLFSLFATRQIRAANRKSQDHQHALERERDKLQALQEQQEQQAWLASTLEAHHREISGSYGPGELFQRTLDFLGWRLPVGCGTGLHFHDGELVPVAERALPPETPRQSLAPGEGLAGEAANRQGLTVVNSVPDDHCRIMSATGHMVARQLVFISLHHEGRCKGIIELALVEELQDVYVRLLEGIAPTLAQAVELAEQRYGDGDASGIPELQAEADE